MKILLISGNNYVLMDDEDYQRVHHLKWSTHKSTDGKYSIRNNRVKLDRFVMNIFDEDLRIKHKDNDPFNVQKHNLIVCTMSQFAPGKKAKKGKKYKGVSAEKRSIKFRAELRVKTKLYYLGLFETEEAAAKAYDLKAKELFGEFANLNFPTLVIKERDTLDLKTLYQIQINKGFEGEIWKACVGWERYYNVSDHGRMFNIRKNKLCPTYPDKDNYVIIHLQTESHKDKYNMKVHRAVAQTFILNPENKPQVNHKDGNKQNNHVNNLEWATDLENKQHAFMTGLFPVGEKCSNSKLTEHDIFKIRAIAGTVTNVEISKQYGVTPGAIGEIINRKTWKHLK